MTRTIDYSALTAPVTAPQIAAFKAAAKAEGKPWASIGVAQVVALVGALIVVAIVAVVSIAFFVGVASLSAQPGSNTPAGLLGLVFPLVFAAAFIAFIVVAARSAFGLGSWERWYRLDTFARANGMSFSPSDANPHYPGAIFNIGDSRRSINHLQSTTDRYLDIGNYTYSTGSGKNRSTHHWGFMALHLDRKLPNMVLDSKANNGLFGGTNLPAYFSKSQILGLEGDFDTFFTLYCPKEYERDALYVFTPDLMALLIDNAAPFDVEIVDDWMFVYSAVAFAPTNPANYERLFRIVDTVGAKAVSQTDRYVDEKVGDFASNIVAPQGRRLKRGASVGAIVAVIVILGFWILPDLIAFLGDLR